MDLPQTFAAPVVTRRADYRPPEWLVPELALDFDLDPTATRVKARLTVRRNGAHGEPLRLDGAGQELRAVTVDGVAVNDWRRDGEGLVIPLPGDAHVVETEVLIAPDTNTQLMGLYSSGGILCTQCEAEGFRRITYFPDRPDVLTRYAVRMTADRARYPVLLANGDPVGEGEAGEGRHWAEWRDPFPKPSYLFALVAGDLRENRGSFTTASGREVRLGIWVRGADLPRTEHALHALKLSMAWDERTYGREYDLDVFNIVAVDDFNFGAMENKGLNVFNSRYILADPDTATDYDYDSIAAVVAHEYFHNWSGNRVTCRDWFQLSLKEGFTVYRDQGFSADQGSAAVKRIEDVRSLRATQFPEDAGPLAHPVRPDDYQEISNFYTSTIYNKGAELIRMMATILGPQRFRMACDLYFDRYDGTAATCEDFVRCMEFGGGVDLTQFRLWYAQAGTPRVSASVEHAGGRATLRLAQRVPATPGQPSKQPMVLPLRLKLFGAETGAALIEERLHILDEASQTIVFDGVGERPVLSINRGFSAPAVIESDRTAADLAFLSRHDDDPFARYEAMQQLMLDTLVGATVEGRADTRAVVDAVGATLAEPALDPAFVAEAVLLPSEAFVGDQLASVDPDAIHHAREGLRRAIGQALEAQWREAYDGPRAPWAYTPADKGLRRLRNVALGYIAATGAGDGGQAGVHAIPGGGQHDGPAGGADDAGERRVGRADRGAGHLLQPLRRQSAGAGQVVSDAGAVDPRRHGRCGGGADRSPRLRARQPQSRAQPAGRVRRQPARVQRRRRQRLSPARRPADRAGPAEPQTAAKLLPPLGRWRRYDEARAALMRAELERIVGTPVLSKDLFEQASKSLGD